MSDLDRLLQQVEELKRLATRPDDSWMNALSNEELQALGQRVRKVADGLSGLQGKLGAPGARGPSMPPQRAGTGSLGSMVKRNTAPGPGANQWAPPGPSRPAASSFAAKNSGMDLASPMRRRVGAASSPPAGTSRPAPPAPQPPANLFSPFSKPQPPPSSGKRGRPQS